MPSWDKIVEWANSLLGTWIGKAVLVILEFLQNEILMPVTEAVIGFGTGIYNGFVDNAVNVLTKSPAEWNGEGWDYISGVVNPVFVIFGCSIITIFFLIGYLGEISDDTKLNPSLWRIMFLFLKIFIAQYMVINCMSMVMGLFGYVEALTDFSGGEAGGRYTYELPEIKAYSLKLGIGTGSEAGFVATDYAMSEWLAMIMEAEYEYDEYTNETSNTLTHWGMDGRVEGNMGFVPALFTTICAVLFMVSCVASGAVIAYTAYMRFFKILLLVPYGSIACSTIAGNNMINRTAVSFFKYAIGVVFEAVTMIVAIRLIGVVAPSIDFIKLDGEYYYCGLLINQCFILFLGLGVVKGAYQLTSRALGL